MFKETNPGGALNEINMDCRTFAIRSTSEYF